MDLSPTRHGTDAALVTDYLLRQAQAHRGQLAFQGEWKPALIEPDVPDCVATLCSQRLWKLDLHATRSLLAWSAGRRNVTLLFHVPGAMDVLAAQARGGRFISLVDDAGVPPPHENGYLFVVHDLCHLEKFADPEHHLAQVGFFHSVLRALTHPSWREVEASLDARWFEHRDAVVSDMNGSVIFLMAALKMKLKMAVRRRLAVSLGVEAPQQGPLSAAELAAFEPVLDHFLALMELPEDVCDAARAVTKKRDTPPLALRCHQHFSDVGEGILQRR